MSNNRNPRIIFMCMEVITLKQYNSLYIEEVIGKKQRKKTVQRNAISYGVHLITPGEF